MILAIIPVPDKFKYDFSLAGKAEELNYLRKKTLKSGKCVVSAGFNRLFTCHQTGDSLTVIQHFIAGLL